MFFPGKGLRASWGGVALAAGVVALTVFCVAGPADAQKSRTSKMKREIRVLENILDQVVIDSRNVLVPSRQSVHGHYMSEFGVMFTTEASLLYDGWPPRNNWNFNNFDWGRVEHKSDRIIIHKKDHDDDDDDDDDEAYDDNDDRSSRTWRTRRVERGQKLYNGVRAELIEGLIEYGDTITGLRDDEWIGVTVYFNDEHEGYLDDRDISRLVIKARMGDVRDYTSGSLSRSAMEDRVVVTEE
jgi:hypothetical protein